MTITDKLAGALGKIAMTRTSHELKDEFGDRYNPDDYDFETCCNHFTLIARQALAEYEAQKETGGWQPIETAPSGAKNVLFFCDGDVQKGYREDDDFFIINNGDYIDGGCGRDYRCDPKNKYEWSYGMPTHWMPLPQPPVNKNT